MDIGDLVFYDGTHGSADLSKMLEKLGKEETIRRFAWLYSTKIEVVSNHLHVLVDAPPTLSAFDIVNRLKSQSTFHIWKKFDTFLSRHFWNEKTFWSDGYFVCTTGDASTETIRQYIEEQG